MYKNIIFSVVKITYQDDDIKYSILSKNSERTSALLVYNRNFKTLNSNQELFILAKAKLEKGNNIEIIMHGNNFILVNQLNEIRKSISNNSIDASKHLYLFKKLSFNYKKTLIIFKYAVLSYYVDGIISKEKIHKAEVEIDEMKRSEKSKY